ncbi:exodeoxyribonuclease III [Hyaloraphidium curvatum]|nr:exodeoxyribonuclease III [Hyaloraphidium curvatum]
MPDTYSLNAPPPTSIKIVSWNVSSLKAAAKKGLPAYVAAENADLLLLQETKLQDAAGLDVLSRKDYPHQFWLASEDKKGYSGSAVLSKIEPISHRYGIGVAEHDKEGRTITLELPKFFLVACYIPNAGQKLERLAYKGEYMTAMETYLKGLAAKKPIIWAGDLNVAHQEVDLARPKENRNKSAGFTDQERGDFSRILDTLGLVDTYRHFHPDTRDFSYYSYRFQCRSKHLGWRLDYFVASKSLVDEGKISESGIRSEVYGASDHVPVYLFVEK